MIEFNGIKYVLNYDALNSFIYSNENIDLITHETTKDIDSTDESNVFGMQTKTVLTKNSSLYNIRYDLFKNLLLLLTEIKCDLDAQNLATSVAYNTLLEHNILIKIN